MSWNTYAKVLSKTTRNRRVDIIVPYETKVFTKSAPTPRSPGPYAYMTDKNDLGWLAVGSHLFLFVLYGDSDL